MPKLHVDLQGGFAQEAVVVSIGGVEAYRHPNLSNLQRLGPAATFVTQVARGSVVLDIDLPERHRAIQNLKLVVSDDSWLAISLKPDGKVVWRTSPMPFGYAAVAGQRRAR